MQHSKVIGGSTAKRRMTCLGSAALEAKMPEPPPSPYAQEGTMLHTCMESIIETPERLPELIKRFDLTEEQVEKLNFCRYVIDAIDPKSEMLFSQEVDVGFPGIDELDGVFGNVDLVGRLGDKALIIDWKFGDGVIVEAKDNYQLLFYAAAARMSEKTKWAFEGARWVELMIVQPPHVRAWLIEVERLDQFVGELVTAVKRMRQPDAPLVAGDHCKFCRAKPICPQMTGAVERAQRTALESLDAEQIGAMLAQADLIEGWIKSLRELAFTMLENDKPVPGYKLVAKRAMRQWTNEQHVFAAMDAMGLDPSEYQKTELLSPAQLEKVLKKRKLALPDELVVAVSSGSTLAPESDPRPAVLNLGRQLTAALSKIGV